MSPRTVRANSRARVRQRAFSLIELLVALGVFATMAALAYGGLDSVARTSACGLAKPARVSSIRSGRPIRAGSSSP